MNDVGDVPLGLGRRLRAARLAAAMSQSDLEALCGIPKARISRYENGHVDPSVRTLRWLARALDVSEAALLEDGADIVGEFFLRLRTRGIPPPASEEQARELADWLANDLDVPISRQADRS